MYCSQNFSRAEKRAFKLVGLPKSPENKPIQLHFILTCNSGKANEGETKLWAVFAGSMMTADDRYYLIAQTIIDDDVILPQVPECLSRFLLILVVADK